MSIYVNEIIRSGGNTILDLKRSFKMNDRDIYIDMVKESASMEEVPEVYNYKYKKMVSHLMKTTSDHESIVSIFSIMSQADSKKIIDLFCDFIRRDEEDEERKNISEKLVEEMENSALKYFHSEVVDDVTKSINRNISSSSDFIPHVG